MDFIRMMRLACRIEETSPRLADEIEAMARLAQMEISVPQSQLEKMYQSGGGAMPSGGTSIGGFYQDMNLGQALPPNPMAEQSAINIVIGGGGNPNPSMISSESTRIGMSEEEMSPYIQKAIDLYSMGYTDPSIIQQMMGQSGNTDLIAISRSPASGFDQMGGQEGIRMHEREHAKGASGTREQMMGKFISKMNAVGGGVLNQEQMQAAGNSLIDWVMAGRDDPREYGANMPVFDQYVLPKYLKGIGG